MKKITDRITKHGNTYSTCDLRPTAEDIKDILSICDPAEETIILRKGKKAMVFQEGLFVCSGEHSRIGGQKFATYKEQELIDLVESEDREWTIDELIERIRPYDVEVLGKQVQGTIRHLVKRSEEEGWITGSSGTYRRKRDETE